MSMTRGRTKMSMVRGCPKLDRPIYKIKKTPTNNVDVVYNISKDGSYIEI